MPATTQRNDRSDRGFNCSIVAVFDRGVLQNHCRTLHRRTMVCSRRRPPNSCVLSSSALLGLGAAWQVWSPKLAALFNEQDIGLLTLGAQRGGSRSRDES